VGQARLIFFIFCKKENFLKIWFGIFTISSRTSYAVFDQDRLYFYVIKNTQFLSKKKKKEKKIFVHMAKPLKA
jgi:hypothetical protein